MKNIKNQKNNLSNSLRSILHQLFSLFSIPARESGQALLIVLMLLAVVVTVVLTISFTSRTDTQITKLEEENQKALAAAEAGIEAALNQGTITNLVSALPNLNNTIASGKVDVTTASNNPFESPLLRQNESYTFYLGSFTPPSSFAASVNQQVRLCFGTSGSQPALDIAILKNPTSSPAVIRHAVSVNPGSQITNSATATNGCPVSGTYSYSYLIPQSDIGADSRLLVVRSLFANTRILISQTNLPAQGKYIDSEATSKTGVTKKIRLLQSYPQLPTEFFSTSF